MDLFSPSCRLHEAGEEVVGVNRDTPRKYVQRGSRPKSYAGVVDAKSLTDAKRYVDAKGSKDARRFSYTKRRADATRPVSAAWPVDEGDPLMQRDQWMPSHLL